MHVLREGAWMSDQDLEPSKLSLPLDVSHYEGLRFYASESKTPFIIDLADMVIELQEENKKLRAVRLQQKEIEAYQTNYNESTRIINEQSKEASVRQKEIEVLRQGLAVVSKYFPFKRVSEINSDSRMSELAVRNMFVNAGNKARKTLELADEMSICLLNDHCDDLKFSGICSHCDGVEIEYEKLKKEIKLLRDCLTSMSCEKDHDFQGKHNKDCQRCKALEDAVSMRCGR